MSLENDYNLSLVYFKKAEEIINNNRLDQLKSLINVNLCDVYEKKGNSSAAFQYGKKALLESQKAGDNLYIGMSFNNIANVFSKSDQTDSALAYYRQAIPFSKTSNAFQTLCETYLGIAKLMERQRKIDSALYNAKLSATRARDMHFNNLYLRSCSLLSRYFANIQHFDSAYFYQAEATQMKDSVFNEEKAKHVQLLTINEEIRQERLEKQKIRQRKTGDMNCNCLPSGC